MPVLAVIPARLHSTRLERKPLQLLGGTPLVVRVAERIRDLAMVDGLVVATDADEIEAVVRAAGFRVARTAEGHQSGTDRVAEVAASAIGKDYDIVVNAQGDEPFLPREALLGAVDRVRQGDDIGTAAAPLTPVDAADPARVKVVTDQRGHALYFSRAAIPFWRNGGSPPDGTYWQHLGVYAFSRAALARWPTLGPAPLERAERLEQLRALYSGMTIGVALLDRPAPSGIDTPDDLRRAEALWHATHKGSR
jgi:3-deoxy-manno-octulosonate cytidylyltransferase (CMP-KDO synthetase)